MFDDNRTCIMALDIGQKRTGVAMSDEGCTMAFPRVVIEAQGKKEWLEKLLPLIEQESPVSIVVGLPLDQFGEIGKDARNIMTYIALLRERVSVPVIEWDESFTTVQAERTLIDADVSRRRRKEVIDKIAASIILQSYLDRQRFQGNPSCQDDENSHLNETHH